MPHIQWRLMATTARSRPRGRPKAADMPVSAEGILAKSLRAFARHGYDGVSVRTLARELDVSHNVIPQRFGSKEKLWYAAVDWGFGGLVDAIYTDADPGQTDGLEQMRSAMRRFLLYSAERPELLGIMNAEGAVESPRLDYIFDTYVSPAIAPLARLLDSLADQGRIRRVAPNTVHFLLAHGGCAPFTLTPLNRRLVDADHGRAVSASEHADFVAGLIVAGLQIDSAPTPDTDSPPRSVRR